MLNKFIITLFLLLPNSGFTMQNLGKIEKIMDGPCIISRLSHETDNFSYVKFYLNNFKPWTALAIEPFYRLTGSYNDGVLKTSPITKIEKINSEFIVHTLRGSIYHVPVEYLRPIDKLRDFQEIFDSFYQCEIDEENIYIRREFLEIKKEIDNGQILNGQSYKTWNKYSAEQDLKAFDYSSALSALKEQEIILCDLPAGDVLGLLNSF